MQNLQVFHDFLSPKVCFEGIHLFFPVNFRVQLIFLCGFVIWEKQKNINKNENDQKK